VAPLGAAPGWEQAEDCPEDLSFQSFTQHATLFLPRFNTDFVFLCFHGQVGKSPIGWFPNVWRPNATRDRTGGGEIWRAEF